VRIQVELLDFAIQREPVARFVIDPAHESPSLEGRRAVYKGRRVPARSAAVSIWPDGLFYAPPTCPAPRALGI
jgi:hypothetical protein